MLLQKDVLKGKKRMIRAESREEPRQGNQGEYCRRRSAADSPGDWQGGEIRAAPGS